MGKHEKPRRSYAGIGVVLGLLAAIAVGLLLAVLATRGSVVK